MKNIYILIILLTSSITGFSQYTAIPDNLFEQKLISLGYDDVEDGQVLTANISGITSLNLNYSSMTDATGIQDFISLDTLKFDYTDHLVVLDVSQNTNLTYLDFSYTNIPSIDLNNNTKLKHLSINADLTNIDVSNNTNLEVLLIQGEGITNIDISNNSNLIEFYCNNTSVTELDLSNNITLQKLSIYNPFTDILNISELDLSNNPDLHTLELMNTSLEDIDFNNNLNLERIVCNYNELNNLDVTLQTSLETISCNNNNITSLNLSQNSELTSIDVSYNNLTQLFVDNGNNINVASYKFDARNNPDLTCIRVDDVTYSNSEWNNIDADCSFSTDCSGTEQVAIPDNNFEQALIDLGYDDVINGNVPLDNIYLINSLQISNKNITDLTGIEEFSSLKKLFCYDNNLTTINLGTKLYLEKLYAQNNNISTIDLSASPSLFWINLNNNNLNNIDLSQNNPSQFFVFLDDNNISSLNLSNNVNLKEISIANNNLNSLDIRNGNNADVITFNTTNNPNLTCIFVDDANYSQTNWVDIDDTSTFVETEDECDALSDVYKIEINKISIFPNPTNSNFTINSKNEILKTITISDITGKTIQKISANKKYISINLSNETKGIYFIEIKTNNRILTSKIIKK